MNTIGNVVPVNGVGVEIYLTDKEDIAFALRHLADTIEDLDIPLVHGMLSYISDTGNTVGQWWVK